MNSNDYMRKSAAALRGCAVVALAVQSVTLFGQMTITRITVPGAASLAVSSLNATGHVSGYYFTDSSAQRAFFWSEGSAVDIGTLGGATTVGNAMNNLGAVVGYSSLAGEAEYHAFLYDGSGLSDLGSFGGPVSSAASINDSGFVTGYAYVSPFSLDYRAFRWSGGLLEDLGTLGGTFSSGTIINSRGQVAGDSTLPGNWESHAFLFSDGMMRDLGTLGGSYSSAFALNELGHVVGQSVTLFDRETHAFLFDGAIFRDLGTLGGTFSAGYAVNDLGQVAGDSYLAGDMETRGFIFENGSMRNLGTLGGGHSSAWAINNLGQIVGISSNSVGRQRAFLWQNDAMIDLNTVLPADSGWDLTGAYFINDAGHVVGDGFHQGVYHWYLLKPSSHENHPPVAHAGADSVLECNGGSATLTLNGDNSSDPDGDVLAYEWLENGQTISREIAPTIAFASGIHVLTLRVTDSYGDWAEDTVIVSVIDSVPPVVLCPRSATVPANAEGTALIPDLLSTLVATDLCATSASLTRSQSPSAGTVVGLGTHTISVRVADPAGHQTSCESTFSVVDLTPPTVQCPEPAIAHANEQGIAVMPDFLFAVVAVDNCTAAAELTKTQHPSAGTIVACGVQTVTLRIADTAGNVATCSFTFTVVDSMPPVIEAPAEITCRVGANCQASVPDLSLSVFATDNCTSTDELVFVQEPMAGMMVDRGTREVRVTVTDAAGNSASRVVVLHAADLSKPEIVSVTASHTQLSPANRKMVSVAFSVIARDNCDPSPISRIVSVTSSEAVTGPGDNTSPDWKDAGLLSVDLRAEVASSTQPRVYTVLLSSTDASGNVSYENVRITVPLKGKKNKDILPVKLPGKKK